MKTIFISFYEAYPPCSGAAIVTYNCARYIDGERFIIQMGSEAEEYFSQDGVLVVTLDGAAERFAKIVRLRTSIRRIASHCQRINPDLIVLEGASWVVYHWLLLRRLRKQCPRAAIAYHSHNVEYVLRREKHGRIVCGITRWAERNVLHSADYVFAVSDVDAGQFERLYGVRPDLLPNGVDVDRFDAVTEAETIASRAKYGLDHQTVLFMGMYAYKPNREAIDLLVHHVFPEVLRRHPDAKLAVLGGAIPYTRSWIINPGSIPYEELPAFLKACTVGVAPILSGSGTRLKILEYMAAGLPVVSTRKGAEGLAVQDNIHLFFADSPESFAGRIVAILRQPQAHVALARLGQQRVREQYAWPDILAAFRDALRCKQ